MASDGPLRVHAALLDARLPSPRSRAVALAFGQGILLCGGLTAGGTTTDSIVRIDLATNSVASHGHLAIPVHDAAAASDGSRSLVFGGGRFGPGSVVQSVDERGASTVVGALPRARADLAAGAFDGSFFVIGGGTPTRSDVAVLATKDGSQFRTVATLAVGVRYPAAVTVDGRLFLIGGSTRSGDGSDISVVDPASGSARVLGHLPYGLSDASAFVLGDEIVVAGGRRAGRVQDEILKVDPRTGAVTRLGRLPYAVSNASTAVVGGVAYLIGGESSAQRLASIVALTLT